MRCLGLLSADDLEASAAYSRKISEEMSYRFGFSHVPKLISVSLHTQDTAEALRRPHSVAGMELLKTAAEALVQMGAEAIVPCASRLQPVSEGLATSVPLIAMPDAVGSALQTLSIRRIGIIGASSEKEEIYWRRQLVRRQVLDVFVPVHRDREHLAHLTDEELHLGVINQSTRADVGRIVYSLRQAGARAIVLLVPELALALSHLDPVLPILDATELHALAALEWSLLTHAENPTQPSKLIREKRPKNRETTRT